MIISLTGHRIQSLPAGFGVHAREALRRNLRELLPTEVYSGMAIGWDTWGAEVAVELQIPLHAILPCDAISQCLRWTPAQQRTYFDLLEKAAAFTVVTPGKYVAGCMESRNRVLVRGRHPDIPAPDRVLALWDGGTSGGTHQTLRMISREAVTNLWSETLNSYYLTQRGPRT